MRVVAPAHDGAARAERWRPALVPFGLLVLGFAIAVAIYHDTTAYGFFYDDYHFVRAYSAREVAGAFGGTWDPLHIEVPFYRPLTVAFFAARFLLFGFHGAAYHWTSILLFGVVAGMVGILVWRVTGARHLAALATALVSVDPPMVRSLAAWVTNQMHLLEALLVLATYLTWFSVRRAGGARWSLILIPALAALFVKEDAAVLLVSVVLIHTLYRHLVDRSLPSVPAWFLGAALVVPFAFAWLRYEVLGGLGGYGRPAAALALARIRRTTWSLLWQLSGRQPPERIITGVLAVVMPTGALVACVRGGVARFLILAGLAILICFSLPFAFAAKAEQLHLVALATCVMLVGAIDALARLMPTTMARAAWWSAVTCFVVLMGAVSASAVSSFAPDAPYTLHTDGIVRGWSAVPEEIRDALARKRPGVPSPRIEDLEYVVCGVSGVERPPDGSTFRWTGPDATFFTSAARGTLSLRLRGLMIPSIGRTRVGVDVEARGFRARHLILTNDAWVLVTVPFARQWYIPAGVPSVRLRIDPTFQPANVFGGPDNRTLGVQLTDIRVDGENRSGRGIEN